MRLRSNSRHEVGLKQQACWVALDANEGLDGQEHVVQLQAGHDQLVWGVDTWPAHGVRWSRPAHLLHHVPPKHVLQLVERQVDSFYGRPAETSTQVTFESGEAVV